ncbi:hypothetical protein [Prevotella falsenii]|nr:hypothetical protein [Prevotella falsenii]
MTGVESMGNARIHAMDNTILYQFTATTFRTMTKSTRIIHEF